MDKLNHYYSSDPNTPHDIRKITVSLREKLYYFFSDAGVFSKENIDFGTKLLINSLQVEKNAQVLDLGCGYGVIGIVVANLVSNGFVYLVDVNKRAVDLAKENIKLNKIENAKAIVSDGFTAIEELKFDSIITNPPIRAGKMLIFSLYEKAFQHLNHNGSLWVVIQKKQGALSTLKKLRELGYQVEEVDKDKGYHVYRARKL